MTGSVRPSGQNWRPSRPRARPAATAPGAPLPPPRHSEPPADPSTAGAPCACLSTTGTSAGRAQGTRARWSWSQLTPANVQLHNVQSGTLHVASCRPRVALDRLCHPFDGEHFDEIAGFEVVEAFE